MDSSVTVFRSADESASEDAAKVHELLTAEGIPAQLLDDDTPGIPSGAWEVRVAAEDQERAERLIAHFPPEDEFADVNASDELDLVTVFRSPGNASGMEAPAVESLLQASGISAVVVGDSRFPNLGQEVRVAKEHVETAAALIAEALAAGPSGAAEAEESGEIS